MFAHRLDSRTSLPTDENRLARLPSSGARAASPPSWRPRFPNRHLVFATLGLCDFVQTCFIISLGGEESNAIALWLIQRWGLAGAAVYKFALVGGIIALVEYLAARDEHAARRLANYSLILGALPVVFGLFLLTLHHYLGLI